MRGHATSKRALWLLSALGAATIAASVALAVYRLATPRPNRASATTSMEERRVSPEAPPVDNAQQAAARRWSPRVEKQEGIAPASIRHDAASSSPIVPVWLDGG